MTGSPYKAHLEASIKRTATKKTEAIQERRGRGGQSHGGKTKRTLQFQNDSGTDESLNHPSDHSDDLLELPIGEPQPDKIDASCLFCDRKFSDDTQGKLWVQSMMCDMWVHSDCAGAKGNYLCL